MDERDQRQLAINRRLYVVWALLGVAVLLAICYLLFNMVRARAPQPVIIGQVDDFTPGSVTLKFVNAQFGDPQTGKELGTLALEVVRDSGNGFTVFYARSTHPYFGSLPPRQCVVEWNSDMQRFVEPCGGAQWTKDGKYTQGPAPRDLDRFPATWQNGTLSIQLELTEGLAHP